MRISTCKLASRCLSGYTSAFPAVVRRNPSILSRQIHHRPLSISPVRRFSLAQQLRQAHTTTTDPDAKISDDISTPIDLKPGVETLPVTCPGCGAPTQWVAPEEAGFYDLHRRGVKKYMKMEYKRGLPKDDSSRSNESLLDNHAESNTTAEEVPPSTVGSKKDAEKREAGASGGNLASKIDDQSGTQIPADPVSAGTNSEFSTPQTEGCNQSSPVPTPMCDRCHDITNHNHSEPIPSPPISYIRDIMDESPFDHNYVYHIVDAADFPLSLIPNIHKHLAVQEHRSRNRRSKPDRFRRGERLADLNIIVSRSDLLAPLEKHVDSLMSVLVEALRDVLGPKVRLGHVRMVSAHRGWWTKELKEKVWENGGAVWVVGKSNVGKSSLITAAFPKMLGERSQSEQAREKSDMRTTAQVAREEAADELDPDVLLPPPQRVDGYPVFPVTSSAPGTTASPIRIPFGRQRGEVIDLPGLSRNSLEEFVKDEHRLHLVMEHRIKADRKSIKPGQSLLLDGLIRITNLDPDVIILAAPFVPLKAHVTSTQKALEKEAGERPYGFTTFMAKDDTKTQLASAGTFELNREVTHIYGEHQQMNSKNENHFQLYRVMAVDILIEGSGWVELACSVRTKHRAPDDHPKIEIFSPKGQFVGSRRSFCAWRFVKEKRDKERKEKRKKLSNKAPKRR